MAISLEDDLNKNTSFCKMCSFGAFCCFNFNKKYIFKILIKWIRFTLNYSQLMLLIANTQVRFLHQKYIFLIVAMDLGLNILLIGKFKSEPGSRKFWVIFLHVKRILVPV